MTRGLFAFSADPVHNGHLDVIYRAANQMRRGGGTLVVAILNNDEKAGKYTFSLDERKSMVERAINFDDPDVPKNIKVVASDGILADVYMREGCSVLFRGIRNEKDQAYEEEQMTYHDLILPGIKAATRYIPAVPSQSHISSSVVKSFIYHGLPVSGMVPMFVQAKLQRRILKQYFIGITGQMGSGKTYVSTRLASQLAVSHNLPVSRVNLDEFVRDLYDEDSEGAQLVREEIAKACGEGTLTPDRKHVDRVALKAVLASNTVSPDTLQKLQTVTAPHIFRLLRETVKGRSGIIILEWAQLVENGLTPIVNNDVIVVDSPDREEFLDIRGVPADVRARFGKEQLSAQDKVRELNDRIDRDNYGCVITFENKKDAPPADIASLAHAVVHILPGVEHLTKLGPQLV